MTNAQLIEAANQAEARLALAVKEQRLAKPTATATKALARLFSQQGKIAAAQVRKAIRESLREASSDDANDIAANAMVTVNKATGRKLKDTLEATAASSMRQGSDANRQRLGIESLSFSLKNPRAEAYVRKRGLESSKSIDEETKSRLRTIIADGMDQGLSPFEIGDLIEEEFDYMGEETGQSYLRTRADLIATTETAAGYGAGEQMVVDDLIDNGLDMIKFWSNTGDDKVSDVCLENTAAGWIGGDEDFPSGDQRPPGHPGCRCAVLDRVNPEQIAEKTALEKANESMREGGEGSGNFGHAGRPGKIGGSSPMGGTPTWKSYDEEVIKMPQDLDKARPYELTLEQFKDRFPNANEDDYISVLNGNIDHVPDQIQNDYGDNLDLSGKLHAERAGAGGFSDIGGKSNRALYDEMLGYYSAKDAARVVGKTEKYIADKYKPSKWHHVKVGEKTEEVDYFDLTKILDMEHKK